MFFLDCSPYCILHKCKFLSILKLLFLRALCKQNSVVNSYGVYIICSCGIPDISKYELIILGYKKISSFTTGYMNWMNCKNLLVNVKKNFENFFFQPKYIFNFIIISGTTQRIKVHFLYLFLGEPSKKRLHS